MLDVSRIAASVKQFAHEAGFELAGIAPIAEFAELGHFSDWVDAGRAGEMKYMEARDDAGRLKRASPQSVFPWARSVIVCAINYNTSYPYSTQIHDPARGWVARYAWSSEDYHDVVLKKLSVVENKLRETVPNLESRSYVDTGPLVERAYAKYAGVGWTGKNTCTINQQLGSWLFLGVILTSLDLSPDLPAPDRCGTCTRCIEACPTDALIEPYQLDANLCISYLTIEKRGTIPESLRDPMGQHIFGCDICQDVCPWNRKAPATEAAEFQPREELIHPALELLAELSEGGFREKLRGSPLKRTKRTGIRRNTVIAMGNSGEPKFLPLLERLSTDEDPVVAEHAQWAEKKLRTQG